MSDNPKSRIENPQSIDPALADHLDELAALAREIGAAEVTVIREPRIAILLTHFGLRDFNPTTLKLGTTGVLVVLRFPASDGGAPGVEVK